MLSLTENIAESLGGYFFDSHCILMKLCQPVVGVHFFRHSVLYYSSFLYFMRELMHCCQDSREGQRTELCSKYELPQFYKTL